MKHLFSIAIIFSFIGFFHSSSNAQLYSVHKDVVNIVKVNYNAGTTDINLHNNTNKSLSLILRMHIFSSETENKFIYESTFTMDGHQKSLSIADQFYCKANIEILTTENQVLARREIKDGEWIIHNPEDLFFNKVLVENRAAQSHSKLIERSMILVPRLYNKVYLTRELGNLDKNYDKLEFYSEGLNELKLTFECNDDEYELFLDNIEDGQQTINISDAKNSIGKPCNLKNPSNIHFELKGYQLAMPIKLIDMQFTNYNARIMTIKKKENQQLVYPNPCHEILNIQMEKAGTYQFEIFNAYQQVYLKMLEVNGTMQLALPALTPGTYFYRISNSKNEWVEQLVVL